MFNKYAAIFLVVTIQCAAADESLTKDFVQKIETLTQKIQQLSVASSIQSESLNEMFDLSNQLHDFIADNFEALVNYYPTASIMHLYAQLDKIGVFAIYAQTVTTVTFKGMDPMGWKNTDELPLHPADEIIFGSKTNAQQHIDSLQQILDNSLNNYYQTAFQVLVHKRLWSAHDKQIVFLSFAFKDFSSNPRTLTPSFFFNFDEALNKLAAVLIQNASSQTKNLRNLNEYFIEKAIIQLHDDLETLYVTHLGQAL